MFSLFVFFTSCENDSGKNNSGDDFSKRPYALDSLLIGKWRSLPYENAEGYNISETLFEYQDGQEPGVWDISYKGVVRYVKSFDSKSGVIIIEYTGGGWPRYTEEGHTISAWVGTPIPGPFFGVYYSNLVEDSVTLANSTTLDSIPPYKPPETASLEEAIAKFTLENRSRFVAGVAVPQKRWE
ncbi:MAG: hypothetical protein LBC53_10105 [Spirochaetaceae bacterium]|nr:hypothetical protein [Spirochaetaceae bacterium]